MEINQPKKVKLEMRGNKFRSGVNWQGMLKHQNKTLVYWKCQWI